MLGMKLLQPLIDLQEGNIDLSMEHLHLVALTWCYPQFASHECVMLFAYPSYRLSCLDWIHQMLAPPHL
jgi:hypothetical protein